jgi:membrane-associated protein
MPYRRFIAFNAAGGVIWGTGFVLLGFLAGNSYAAVEKAIGRGVALAVLGLVLLALLIWRSAGTGPNAGRRTGQRPDRPPRR